MILKNSLHKFFEVALHFHSDMSMIKKKKTQNTLKEP